MKTLQAAFVGFLVSSVALIFIAGGPDNAVQIVGLSIICTFGAGLLFWVPLWIIVGYTVLLMIKGLGIAFFGGSAAEKDLKPEGEPDAHDDLEEVEAPVTSPSHAAILEYVTRAKQAGMAENVLIDRLRTKGWNADEIYSALRRYEKKKKKRPKIS